jgi:hypothetical protein
MKSLLSLIEQSFCPPRAQNLTSQEMTAHQSRFFMTTAPIAAIHTPVNEADPTLEKEILKV